MSANAYARIAERYEVNSSDEESVERFFLDVAPTLSHAEREAIVAELLADQLAGPRTFAAPEVPREVPTFPLEDAPPIRRPNSLTQLVGELSAAVEKRVTERLDTVIARALDRLQEQTGPSTGRRYGRGREAPVRRGHRIADLIEGQTVTVVEPGSTVRTAAQRMVERNIGVVAVVEKGTLAGVFSERDIMVRVVARGLNPDDTPVATVMTKDIVTAEADDDLDSALERMHSIGARHLPVIHDGKLVGMISMRDLLEVDDDEAIGKAAFRIELLTYSPD